MTNHQCQGSNSYKTTNRSKDSHWITFSTFSPLIIGKGSFKGTYNSEVTEAFNEKVDDIKRLMKKITKYMHTVQVGCDNYNEPRIIKEYSQYK